jgi:hydroxyethylthiazole kinase-like sugar kinase family protein
MPLPDNTKINIVEFFVLPKTLQPTVRMTFDVEIPVCANAEDSRQRRFQTDVVVPGASDPVTEEQRNQALADGWDMVEADVLTWCSACSVCPVGKAFDPTAKALV